MAVICIPMEINIRGSGIMMCKMVLGRITIQMAIFIKENGKMENRTVRAITSTKTEKPYIREIGNREKSRHLVNLLLKILMDILVIGNKTRKTARDHIYILMDKSMRVNGQRIKNVEPALITIKMGMFIRGAGRMTGDAGKEG